MTRALAMVCALLCGAGCFYETGLESQGDTCASGGPHVFASDPATGKCFEFASSCDVPKEWPPCGMDPAPGCYADQQCPMGMGCVNGACGARGAACMSDQDCPLTQSCIADAAGLMACMDNTPCSGMVDGECPMGQWCDTMPNAGTCDPMTDPNCGGMGVPVAPGLCSRGEVPPAPTCTSNSECGEGMICPAQWGGCSAGDSPDGVSCPSWCEAACYSDGDCASGFRCNAMDVCASPNPGMNTPLPVCAGWCVAMTMMP